jgi:tRNA-binding protein
MAEIDDFNKLDIRTGIIREVKPFPEARKPAYKLYIDFGPETGMKQSSAQLAGNYSPEDLTGKMILAVVNFLPRRIASFQSEVLVLGVPDANGETILAVPEITVPAGAKLY